MKRFLAVFIAVLGSIALFDVSLEAISEPDSIENYLGIFGLVLAVFIPVSIVRYFWKKDEKNVEKS